MRRADEGLESPALDIARVLESTGRTEAGFDFQLSHAAEGEGCRLEARKGFVARVQRFLDKPVWLKDEMEAEWERNCSGFGEQTSCTPLLEDKHQQAPRSAL